MCSQNNDQRIAYAKLFITFSNSVEKWLKRSITILLIALICFQFLLQSAEIRFHITTIGKLEGIVEEPVNGQ